MLLEFETLVRWCLLNCSNCYSFFSGCEQEDDGGFEFVATLFSASLETTSSKGCRNFLEYGIVSVCSV